ncbi:hypothetical protein [Paenibacillus sp. 8b26]|uniref:hypothetical protein n=1 Tax=Paenibacillus sp. 8b26 TaxID=3424133 RepID=UPI003D6468D3
MPKTKRTNNWNQTALVVIDLQKWIGNQYPPILPSRSLPTQPNGANQFRDQEAFVALVHVAWDTITALSVTASLGESLICIRVNLNIEYTI